MKLKGHSRLEVFFEFLVFGLLVGITEDLIAIKFATDEPFTWKIVGIVTLVAIPFAFLGEVIVDRVNFIPKRWRNNAHKH